MIDEDDFTSDKHFGGIAFAITARVTLASQVRQIQRVHVRVEGTVQGVGFRPYVYRLARSLSLTGFVRNDARGVVLEIEGAPISVERFMERLPREAPPLAICEGIAAHDVAVRNDVMFTIVESDGTVATEALVTPDTATCTDCLAELFDSGNRRYRYPFINCTNCGPRFTIVQGVPYDRQFTTMAGFTMCPQCLAEYEDPADRRFHAQPNACPTCGPQVQFIAADGSAVPLAGARDAVAAAARALCEGAIVAVKGVGGYHLACVASCDTVVARLRERKHRPDKPFAVMAADITSAEQMVELDVMEAQLLTSRERPIILARRRPHAMIAQAVAPRQRNLGIMLPYSPLHHLLLADVGEPLVMTSGNVSDEPIAFEDVDARDRLGHIADAFLVHNRPIETRTDDSVVRVMYIGGTQQPVTIRRSRGYVPVPLALPVTAPRPLLACGGQLKNTFCLVRDRRAWIGPHIGDLENYETLCSYTRGIEHIKRLFAVVPDTIVHDAHPEYLSTKYALEQLEQGGVTSETVQHHHAHLASCLAEYNETEPALGVIFDGTGYGTNGEMWGGEILLGDLNSVKRVAHLWPVRLPGGEAAVREPWRMACSWLSELAAGDSPVLPYTIASHSATPISPRAWHRVVKLVRSGVASPYTTSMGRLLDAISALCGVCLRISYEGQAAIEFENIANPSEYGRYRVPLIEETNLSVPSVHSIILDARVLIQDVMAELGAGVAVDKIAARVHNGVAYASAQACILLARRYSVTTIVLSGGVFQNALLVERTASLLSGNGLRVLVPRRVPMNDGGISLGQAAVAVTRMLRQDHTNHHCKSLDQASIDLCA
jgi:hydrogenase maturation protein HypF